MVVRSLVIAISLALFSTGCEASRAKTRGDAKAPAAPHDAVAPRAALGVVAGGPWMVGGPPKHARWQVIDALDVRYDIVPVDLDRDVPSGIGLLIVPLLTALTQPQLDRLRSAIEAGLPAIVIVDPLPLFDLRFLPSEPLIVGDGLLLFDGEENELPKGDAIAFLARFGVAWKDDVVLFDSAGDASRPAEAIVAERVGKAPVLFGWAGALDTSAAPLARTLFSSRHAATRRSGDYHSPHPLFGPSLITPPAIAMADPGPRVLATRVGSPEQTGRGELVVIADLDMFSTAFVAPGLDLPTATDSDLVPAGNAVLLQELVAHTLGPGTDPPTSKVAAPLIDPLAVEDIARIDLVTRHPAPKELSNAPPVLEWFRLERRGDDWWVIGRDTELADRAQVESLVETLTATQWEASSSNAIAPIDPGISPSSNAMRVVAQDESGATIVDLLVEKGAGPRAGRLRFESATRTVRLGNDPPLRPSAYLRALQIGPARDEIAAAKVTTYRLDVAQGKLTDVNELTASSAGLAALVAARFVPHERFGGKHGPATLARLASLGFYVTPDGSKLFGSIGHVVVSRKRGKDCSFYFGDVVDGARMVLIEDSEKTSKNIVVYRLVAADERSILVGTP